MQRVSIRDFDLCYQTPDREVRAITGVNIDIEDREFVSIIGPSGCGKSTLLSAISGMNQNGVGQMVINGNVGYMPQQDCLFPWRRVMDNVLLGPELHHKADGATRAYASRLLDIYGLGDSKSKYPQQLSGGMRQRVALIRTLVFGSDILLLDEAFSALDYQTRLKVVDDIYSIIRRENKTALLVTHDISEAISVSDQVYVMTGHPGKITASVRIEYPRELIPSERRQDPGFQDYFHKLREELEYEETS